MYPPGKYLLWIKTFSPSWLLDQLIHLKPSGGKKDHYCHKMVSLCSNLLSVTAHKTKQALTKAWRFPQPKVVEWQAAWPFSTLVVRLGSSPGSPCFITCYPCYWFNSASARQTLTRPDIGVRGARSRVTRSMTSSGLFAIGWWSVTSRLIDRWVKSMLRLARREIMADEITTVPDGRQLKMIDPTGAILGIWETTHEIFLFKYVFSTRWRKTFKWSIFCCVFPVWWEAYRAPDMTWSKKKIKL